MLITIKQPPPAHHQPLREKPDGLYVDLKSAIMSLKINGRVHFIYPSGNIGTSEAANCTAEYTPVKALIVEV